MAYDEKLADRLREQFLLYNEEITEKKMFGGLSFLYKGKMTVGIIGDQLAVRVVSEKIEDELEKHNVRPMDFTKRPMKEFIYVDLENEKNLSHWIGLGLEHAKNKLKAT